MALFDPSFDLVSWDPWGEMRRLKREMSQLFRNYMPGSAQREFPPVNVWADAENIVVTAEIPGIDPKAIDISVLEDSLTIKGSRTADEVKEGKQYHRNERPLGDFARTLRLPYHVDTEKVQAHCDKGVLRATLPRAAEDKPKRIEIET